MKKFLVLIALIFLFAKPISAFAEEVLANTEAENSNTILLTAETEEAYTIEFTLEEKAILLDSIQTIRAILVLILVAIVFYALFTFIGWFF
jgi:hypothetical protein